MKIPEATVSAWIGLADAHFKGRPMNRYKVETGGLAWLLAGELGMLKEAYSDRKITDAHVKTALKRVFPNAHFADAYHY